MLVQDERVVCEDSAGMLVASTDGRVCEQPGGDNREETIVVGVAKAITRHGDVVHDVRGTDPL